MENEYGQNIIQDGEGSSLASWKATNTVADGAFKITDGSMEQSNPITDNNRSTSYKLSYECIALRSMKSCFILYWEYGIGTLSKCTKLIPIMATGTQEIILTVPENASKVSIICRGDMDIKNISLQHDTGLNKKIKNAIAEVTSETVINVETAHILNAWIKNLFVDDLQTNMEALLDGVSTERYFIREREEICEMVYQVLNPKEQVPLMIKDPNGAGEINVYYTAIGEHPDAYKYFTITHPRNIHPDLTDEEVEAFKVLSSKVVSESVKYSRNFESVIDASGKETKTPIEWWGQGTSDIGNAGRVKIMKQTDGYTIEYYHSANDGISGIRLGEKYAEFKDKDHAEWTPIGTGGGAGGAHRIFTLDALPNDLKVEELGIVAGDIILIPYEGGYTA